MGIRLIKSSFYHEQETKDKLCDFIQKSTQLSISEYCKEFEKKFSQWQGRKYTVFVNSWSSANLILLQSLLNIWKINKWDKIWFSSLTWATNVMPIIELWLTPIPVDVDLNTLNTSSQTLQECLKENNIKVLFITNLLWFCDDIDSIKEICNEKWIILLEDNCESMWTVYKGKKLWNYSLASTFSTYVWHHMSTIEWWMVCTDDEELYKMLYMTRAHWRDRNLPKEEQDNIRKEYWVDGTFYAKYTFYTMGFNVRPNEIAWFIGCEQIGYLDEIVQRRDQNFKRFIEKINQNEDFYKIKYEHIDLLSNFAVPVICKSKDILEKYIKKFGEKDIEIRPIVGGDITQQIFWKKLYWENQKDTNAKLIHEQGFYFWNSPEYTEEEISLLLSLM